MSDSPTATHAALSALLSSASGISINRMTDLVNAIIQMNTSLASIVKQIAVVSITVGAIPAGDLFGNPGPGSNVPVGVTPTGGISLTSGGDVEVEWNAGTVATLGSGLNLTGGTLSATGGLWNAGSVAAIANSLTIGAGNTLAVVTPAAVQGLPSNPTGTANTAGTMMGLAGTITPKVTGTVALIISGSITTSGGAGDGAKVQIRVGTGSSPANGATATGTALGALQTFVSGASGEVVPFSLNVVATGLTVGTAYWIDVTLQATTGGTASISAVSITALELP
jgi:hypothetical protein